MTSWGNHARRVWGREGEMALVETAWERKIVEHMGLCVERRKGVCNHRHALIVVGKQVAIKRCRRCIDPRHWEN
jgi:hypothetical protein